jgi:Reverse transcriptase (RNA-dependent DNA polymerase)
MIVELANVKTIYLNTAFHKFIHTEQPLYFELKDHAKYVLLLNEALYRLPQSIFEWAAMLCPALEALGFHSIADDDNPYSNSNSNDSNDRECTATIFIAVYVDDLVIASKDQLAIDTTIHNLNKTFNVHSLGPMRFLSHNNTRESLHGEILSRLYSKNPQEIPRDRLQPHQNTCNRRHEAPHP